jgi:hypothetical protein
MKNTNNIETDDFKLPFVGREGERANLFGRSLSPSYFCFHAK